MILGLDLGTNSIGWALIEYEKNNPQKIVDCGVRIFQEAVDAKTRTPKNQARRQARAARRLVSRRKMRRHNLTNLLVNAGLLPEDQMQRERLLTNPELDPYQLRKNALDSKLGKYEIGRILYHLCQRRGFLSNRKLNNAENSKIAISVSELQEAIHSSNSRTLGEYLADQPFKRGIYTDRSMYQKEFELIWASQEAHYPDILTSPLKVAIHNSIFFQRPLKIQKHLIGKCSLEPSRKRAAKALIEYQNFRLLSDLNNLEIKNPITREYRQLTDNEKEKLLRLLEKQKSVAWGKARTTLGLHSDEIFNLEEGKKKELIGNRTAYTMRSILKKQWDDLAANHQYQLITDMLTIDDEQGFLKRMESFWGFDSITAEKLAKTELEQGYANLSRKAIRKILPYLEKGLIYSEACLEAGYNHSNQYRNKKNLDKLGEPPFIRNPVVNKSLYETRKLINAIIRKYGKPTIIRLEMAREMKLSKKQKQAIEKQQSINRKKNEEATDILTNDFGIQNPTKEDVQKYNLWKECNALCPYTGKPISAQMLFTNEVDVEHIIPYSRSLDNSFNNKTLCLAKENRLNKLNKTPYEAYHANPEIYEGILQRSKHFKHSKKMKFEQKYVETDKFIERQLNDTRYICREVKDYLQTIGVSVEVSKGTSTWALRHHWNLNRILATDDNLEKNRSDHRHHAVDAIVIALTSRSLFQTIAYLSKTSGRYLGQSGFKLEEPWPLFYSDANDNISDIIVSYAPSRKISGALHEETAYGYSEHDNCFVYRKPLSVLTLNEIEKIRDEKVKCLVKKRLSDFGGSIKSAFGDDSNPLLHNDGKTPIKTVRLKLNLNKDMTHPIKNKGNKPFKYHKYGNNHHVEIIENIVSGKRKGIFVTALEAAKRARTDKATIVNRDHGSDWRFVMSLSVNDMIEIEDINGKQYYRVQKMSDPVIILRHHSSTSTANTDKPPEILRLSSNTFRGSKVNVDYHGVITPCND